MSTETLGIDSAAPVVVPADNIEVHFGLTKREYFAAAALFGLAHQSAEDLTVAKAVRLADALIAALNKEPKTP